MAAEPSKKRDVKKGKSTRTSGKSKRTRATMSRNKVVFNLSAADAAKMRECLKRSGSIKFTFKEVSVTKLPQTKDDGVLID